MGAQQEEQKEKKTVDEIGDLLSTLSMEGLEQVTGLVRKRRRAVERGVTATPEPSPRKALNEILKREPVFSCKRLSSAQAGDLGILALTREMCGDLGYSYDDQYEENSSYPGHILQLAEVAEIPTNEWRSIIRGEEVSSLVAHAIRIGYRELAEAGLKCLRPYHRAPFQYELGYVSPLVQRLDEYIERNKSYEENERVRLALLLAEKFPGRGRRVLEQLKPDERTSDYSSKIDLALKIGDDEWLTLMWHWYQQVEGSSIYFWPWEAVKLCRYFHDNDSEKAVIEGIREDDERLLCVGRLEDMETRVKLLRACDYSYWKHRQDAAAIMLRHGIRDPEVERKVVEAAEQDKDPYTLAITSALNDDIPAFKGYVKESREESGLRGVAAELYRMLARRMLGVGRCVAGHEGSGLG